MDLKNIIAAIALSAAVIVLYGLFFAPSPEQLSKSNKIQQNEIVENNDIPSLEDKVEVKTISRQEALNSSQRITFENEFIKGSISLDGGLIDDLELKTYNKILDSKNKIQLLNPASTNEGYTFNTGWATKSDVRTPNSDTEWKVDGSKTLTPNNPVKLFYVNDKNIRFEREIAIDNKYLFSVKQTVINQSDISFKLYPYATINRNNLPSDLTDFYILHEGYTLISGDSLEEVDYDDVEEKKFSTEGTTGVLIQGGLSTYAVPSGAILLWSGAANAIPSGWVLCNGQNNTPDLRGRFVVGYHDGDGDYDVGDTGGAETVTLTEAQMPSHNHTTTVDGTKLFPAAGGTTFNYGGAGVYPGTVFSMSDAGSDQAHENRPPYYALCYIMKT